MVTDIVIPVKNELHYTKHIVEQLQEMDGWTRCWIFDNGSTNETLEYLDNLMLTDNRFVVASLPSLGIYELWDAGMVLSDADHIAFLNNDVMLHPQTITALNNALIMDDSFWIAYPDYTHSSTTRERFCNYRVTKGTYRHGGMSGFCFMLKRNKIEWEPLVDRRFKWWCGDDDIAFEVEARGGKQVRVIGLPIQHAMEGTARHYNLGAQKAADLKLCLEKWGR